MADMVDKQMLGRGGGYGLDAELARKQAANYDFNAERTAQEWMESVLGEGFNGGFEESLKDGVLLCKLVNVIKPGSVKKINNSSMPFKMMENISNFLKACRALGVAEHSLFETVDLFEGKDLMLVIKCLYSLGSTIQSTVPDFPGPHLGAKLHTANKREFTQQQIQQGKSAMTKIGQGSHGVMQASGVVKTGITMGADYAGLGDSGAIPQTGLGSYGIMASSGVVRTGITMGAEYSGESVANGVVPHTGLGSYGIMQKSDITRTGITMGAEYSGQSVDSSVIPHAGLGSYGIMDKSAVTRTGITMGAEYSGDSVDNSVVPLMETSTIVDKPEIIRNGITMGAHYSNLERSGA